MDAMPKGQKRFVYLAFLMCIELYGRTEAERIWRTVEGRFEASGRDGAFADEIVFAVRDTAVQRHPWSAQYWAERMKPLEEMQHASRPN